jgi:2',3'-cyclic-nucleotide 2'-phosphodiesterase (5'-nucleotidase family)
VADAVRVYTGADVAFVNSGGLRADFRRGPLTRRDIKELLPFDNSIAVFTCSGEQLMAIMRHNALAAVQESHGILQVSGIRCLYETIEGDSIRIKSLLVNDEDVERDRMYECATVDFVASSNPTKYLGFKPAHVYDYQLAIGELAIRTLENTERITSTIEGRFVQSEGHGEDRS